MNAINIIRTIALTGALFMTGLSLQADAADTAAFKPTIIDATSKDAKAFYLGTKDPVYIQERLNRLSPEQRARKWATLMDGEVVTIDGQLAVIWTRFNTSNGDHHLMVTNFGTSAISEELALYYLDDMGKDFPVIEVPPGQTGSAQVTVFNYTGTDEFALYDSNGNFLTQLRWGDRYIVVYYDDF